tara:strand:+ start:2317 stop:2694 length:378 start_codon:yes stop_codon:yes gene_type:complete
MIKINFEKNNGLIPTIVQDFETGQVLMLAYMNKEAWEKTLETKRAHFYSRSRNKQWMKGEESGNIQEVKEIFVDCDEDTILLKVNQIGDSACHTGYRSCFFRNENGEIIGEKIFNPEDKYEQTNK